MHACSGFTVRAYGEIPFSGLSGVVAGARKFGFCFPFERETGSVCTELCQGEEYGTDAASR